MLINQLFVLTVLTLNSEAHFHPKKLQKISNDFESKFEDELKFKMTNGSTSNRFAKKRLNK